LSAVLAVAAMWIGLVLAYAVPTLPPSFTIMAVAALEYAVAALVSRPLGRRVAVRSGRVLITR
jgi:zinc/manganese transport system permease protein